MLKRYKDFLMSTASWNTMRWVESVNAQFPRPRQKETAGAITQAALHNENGKLIYRT